MKIWLPFRKKRPLVAVIRFSGTIAADGRFGSSAISDHSTKNLIEKASICVNGISLTISKVLNKGFQIWVIPHTYNETNLSTIKKSDLVNIEIDILSKYVRNYLNAKK